MLTPFIYSVYSVLEGVFYRGLTAFLNERGTTPEYQKCNVEDMDYEHVYREKNG